VVRVIVRRRVRIGVERGHDLTKRSAQSSSGAFPNVDLDLLRTDLGFVRLDLPQVLERLGDLISHVYFIESGLVSLVGVTKPKHCIEVGMLGYEGMTGHGVVLGITFQ
jgi:hypothetical protein